MVKIYKGAKGYPFVHGYCSACVSIVTNKAIHAKIM